MTDVWATGINPDPNLNPNLTLLLLLLLLLLLAHLFNGLFSRTTWASQHQKGKLFCILLEQELLGWQWHQLDHMQIICTSLQTDNHASTSSLGFYRPDALPATQPTASKHLRQPNPTVAQMSTTQMVCHPYICTLQ